MGLTVLQTIPTLRIFDVAKAREFYLDYLGFKVGWEHRFDDRAPLYMQVSLGSLVLHLSEHHGDGSPGVHVFVRVKNLAAYHAELIAKPYGYLRPGIDDTFYHSRQVKLTDPFGNQIHLDESNEA